MDGCEEKGARTNTVVYTRDIVTACVCKMEEEKPNPFHIDLITFVRINASSHHVAILNAKQI